MSDIDHKAEAVDLFERGARDPSDGSYFFANDTNTLLAAQVQATLYAAEQQRIANLIAFTSRPGFIQTPDILQQIEKGLGI